MTTSRKTYTQLINEAIQLEKDAEYFQSIGNQVMYVTCTSTAKFKRAKAAQMLAGKE